MVQSEPELLSCKNQLLSVNQLTRLWSGLKGGAHEEAWVQAKHEDKTDVGSLDAGTQ
jgi:hypothetical protein